MHIKSKFNPKKIFGVSKPLIAMLHMAALPGQSGYKSMDEVIQVAFSDLQKLQKGGVNGLLIENWKENSVGPLTKPETADAMLEVIRKLKPNIRIPYGINVLNNDYEAAFRIASATGASFVELDVFTDHVLSDFKYSSAGIAHPFEIRVDTADVARQRTKYGLNSIPLLVFIQPKHYKMIDPNKTIEESALEVEKAGANGILITRATGIAPDIERIKKVKAAVGANIPVGIGSGFSKDNAAEFLLAVDFVVVGSACKYDGDVDKPVDPDRVHQLMQIVRKYQKLRE